MVKVLATGDFDGKSFIVRELAKKAKDNNVDLVVLCGDITDDTNISSDIIKPFLDAGKKVVFVGGNHDRFSTMYFFSELYNIKLLHGRGVKYGHLGFFGCSGANIGIEQLSEEEIFSKLQEGFSQVNYLSRKVMVTHVFPKDSLMDKLSHPAVIGSEGVSKAIKELKPDILFCGHAHEAEGVEEMIDGCRVICVGREGKIVEL